MPATTDAPALRLFAAASPAAPVRAALHALQQAWRTALAQAGPACTAGVRTLPADALHLTLRFYGATPPDRLAPLCAALGADAARAAPSAPVLQRLECWPPRAPRVVAAVFDTPPPLAALAAALEASARDLGFAPEPRRFRAHVTLARCRGRPLPRVALGLPGLALAVDAITLFQSRTLPEGAAYTPLHTFPLPR